MKEISTLELGLANMLKISDTFIMLLFRGFSQIMNLKVLKIDLSGGPFTNGSFNGIADHIIGLKLLKRLEVRLADCRHISCIVLNDFQLAIENAKQQKESLEMIDIDLSGTVDSFGPDTLFIFHLR